MKKDRNFYIWAVAGVYLIYLGVKQFLALFGGTASIPALSAVSGVLFVLVGGAVLLREWRGYRHRYFDEDSETEQEENPEKVQESEKEQ